MVWQSEWMKNALKFGIKVRVGEMLVMFTAFGRVTGVFVQSDSI